MKCSGSPTTFTAVDPLPVKSAVANAVAAIVFREVLKPLAAGLGPVGEVAVGAVADRLFAVAPR
jgi:hypothetical protein